MGRIPGRTAWTGSASTAPACRITLTRPQAPWRFLGKGGDDSIRGGLGDDTLLGGEGNDLLDGGETFASYQGWNGIPTYDY